MTTRSASRVEEQMAALLEKMDRQSEQLEDLAKRQTEHLNGLARKQKHIREHVSAVESDVNLVKATVDGRLCVAEGSLTDLRTELHEELLERQEQQRKELRHELLPDCAGRRTDPYCPFVCTSKFSHYATDWQLLGGKTNWAIQSLISLYLGMQL